MDPIVRVEAGRLRRALEYYYLTEGRNDPVRIKIPKGSYVPEFIPVTERPVSKQNPISGQSDNGYMEGPCIAVMPLENLSGDDGQDYFMNGLTEELTNELSRFQDFPVIASQSTMHFKGRVLDPGEIGKALGARFLLIGSGRKSNKTIKISVRLIDSDNCKQVWAKDYRRNQTATDFIVLQEEITHSIVGIIADQYGLITRRLSRESRRKSPEDFQAYDAVLRFYHYETQLTPEAFEEALKGLEAAVEKEPDYGLAWAMLGHLHADNYALGFRKIKGALKQAYLYANKGVALAPDNQFAHDALSLVYFHRGDKELYLQQVEEILDLNPNSPYTVGVAGWHLMLFGEWERGLSLLNKGIRLNPYHPTWFHLATFLNFYRQKDYENALSEALRFNYPSLYMDPLLRAAALGQMGRTDEAKDAVQEILKLIPDFKDRGRKLLGHYIKVDSLVDKILRGLKKAGL